MVRCITKFLNFYVHDTIIVLAGLSFNFVFIFFRTNRPESMKVIVANCSLIFAAFFDSRLAALSLPYCFIIYFLFHFAGWQQKE